MRNKLLLFILLSVNSIVSAQSINLIYDTLPAPLGGGYIGRSKTDFLVEPDGGYWISFFRSGILHKDSSGWLLYKAATSGLISDTVYCLAKDSSGRLWAGTDQGISIYDGSSWTQLNTSNGLQNDTISCIAHSLTDTWIGTKQGLAHYNGIWTYYNTSNSPLPVDSITALEIDSTGLWIGTDSGLIHYDGNAWTLYNPDNSNLTSWTVRGITSGPQALFIGTFDQGYFALRNGHFIRLDNYIGGDVIMQLPGYPLTQYSESMRKPYRDASGIIYLMWGQNNFGSNLLRIDQDFEFTQAPLWGRIPAYMNLIQMDGSGKIYFGVAGIPLTTASAIYNPWIPILTLPVDFKPLPYMTGLSNDFLSVNHVKARINVEGDMHWDPVRKIPLYLVPDSLNPVYASALWIAGIDEGGVLHAAAHTYRQEGSIDYFAGPVDTVTCTTDSARAEDYSRLWNIRRDTLNSFIQHYIDGKVTNGTYTIPEVILNWPAHGTGNISRSLAPFVDNNGDGIYNPYDGDYPAMKGDQMLFWIFNDTLSYHGETNASPLGVEVHGFAWAYTCNGNDTATEVLNNSTFYRYEIYNRSPHNYNSVYVGLWMDPDLGNASDDYVGCDTMLNTGFVYNGDYNDDGGEGYGLYPPMQNITILKGPGAYSGNNYDDDHNGLTDETDEKIGMSDFHHYYKAWPSGIPYDGPTHYYLMTSRFLDGKHVTYGGTGRDQNNPPTNYMYSGIPYDTAGWTMASANIQPDDMRMILSSGPFHLGPGEMQSIDFAYIFTRDTTGPNGLNTSIRQNRSDVSKVISWYNNNTFPCFITPVEIPPVTSTTNVYPNPANDVVYLPSGFSNATVQLFDVNGKLLADEKYTDAGISIAHFARQLIIFRINNKGNISYARVIKM